MTAQREGGRERERKWAPGPSNTSACNGNIPVTLALEDHIMQLGMFKSGTNPRAHHPVTAVTLVWGQE